MIDIKMDVTMGKSREVAMGVSNVPSVFRGDDGATFTPSVDELGVISFTNDGGLVNPPPQNIKGPQGNVGPQGVKGDMGMSEAELRESINKIIGDVNSNLEVRLNGDINESLEVRLNGN